MHPDFTPAGPSSHAAAHSHRDERRPRPPGATP